MMNTFGLIGKKLSHSYSQQYFQTKFLNENIASCQYLNFEMNTLEELKILIKNYNVQGLNVTIPYKEKIIPYLDEISSEGAAIGAVNTIEISNSKIIGHNTDVFGFEYSFLQFVGTRKKAIILGNGGASKAIQYVLKKNDISFLVASRNSNFTIEQIDKDILSQYSIIINPQTEISLNRELKTQLEAGEITKDKAEDIKANFKAQQSAAYSIQNQSLSGQKRIKAIYLLAEKNKQVSQNPVGDSNKSIDGNIEKLEKFKSLLDAGVLTQEEFDKMKKSILEKM